MTMNELPMDNQDVETKAGRLTSVADVQAYVTAGNATVTLVSMRTGTRFTYRVRSVPAPADGRPSSVSHFVNLLNGPDNEGDFVYLGFLRSGMYEHGRKSKISGDAASNRAFDWFFNFALLKSELPTELEVYHEGRCGACGRKLTVPESIARGLGPECAGKTR